MAHTFESESSEFGTNLAFWDSEALLPDLRVERIWAHVVPESWRSPRSYTTIRPRDLIRLTLRSLMAFLSSILCQVWCFGRWTRDNLPFHL